MLQGRATLESSALQSCAVCGRASLRRGPRPRCPRRRGRRAPSRGNAASCACGHLKLRLRRGAPPSAAKRSSADALRALVRTLVRTHRRDRLGDAKLHANEVERWGASTLPAPAEPARGACRGRGGRSRRVRRRVRLRAAASHRVMRRHAFHPARTCYESNDTATGCEAPREGEAARWSPRRRN